MLFLMMIFEDKKICFLDLNSFNESKMKLKRLLIE